jgi:hypothetical protein
MVAIAPLVRRYRFIPERITLHAEELAYLWQRRRASLRAPDITLPDFTYLQERIEAHLQGLLVAGDELATMLDGFLHGDQRDEAFAAAWALLRSEQPDAARKVLEAFAAARGRCWTALPTRWPRRLRRIPRRPSRRPWPTAARPMRRRRRWPSAATASSMPGRPAWPACCLTPAPPLQRRPGGRCRPSTARPAPRRCPCRGPAGPSPAVRQAVLDVAVWRGEPWVLDVVRQLAAEGDEIGLGWYAALCPADEQDAAVALFAGRPLPQRTALAARLGRPAAIRAVFDWMADPDPILAAAAAEAWERMTGLSVEGERKALPAAASADPLEHDFPAVVFLPDLAKARQHWATHGERWLAGAAGAAASTSSPP